MEFRLTKDLLAVLIFLLVVMWCVGSYVPVSEILLAGQPPGSYPGGWIYPLFALDAVVAVFGILCYAVVGQKVRA